MADHGALGVLVVEDHPGDRELIRPSLDAASCPFEVRWSTTLADGLEVLSQQPFDVIRRYLAGRQCRRSTPTVAIVTAEVDESYETEVVEGVDSFLNSLLRHDELLFRAGPHTWLMVVPVTENRRGTIVARLERCRQEVNRNQPCRLLPEIALRPEEVWHAAEESERIVSCVRSRLTAASAVAV